VGACLFLGDFGLFAHQDLLELFWKDVNVAREQREKVGIIEVNVRIYDVLTL